MVNQHDTSVANDLAYPNLESLFQKINTGLKSSLFWVIEGRRLVVSYWRYGTTCRFHIQASSCP